jgi:hypothetical protein
MKHRFVYVAAIALIASGLVFAQSSTAPNTQDTQSGSVMTTAPQASGQTDVQQNAMPCESSKANTNSQAPGSMSAYQGAGRTPEAGLNRGDQGTTNYHVDTEHVEIEQGRADAGR